MKQLFLAFLSLFIKKPTLSPAVPVKSGVDGVPQPKPSDWVMGKETGIVADIRLLSGDWRPYLSPGKWQRDMISLFETEGCMSFTPVDCIEAQMNFMLSQGLISDDNVAWLKQKNYIDATGKVNLSPRFTAYMSGTTENGNGYQNVWNSLRNDGVVPDSMWPANYDALIPLSGIAGQEQKDWNIYYARPTDAVIALGQEWKTRFTIQYDWVNQTGVPVSDNVLSAALQYAPLHIISAVCPPWNTSDILKGCGIGTAHATTLTAIEGGIRQIRDHYEPFDKKFAPDYQIPYAVRGVLVETIPVNKPPHFTHQFATPYKLGDTAVEIELIQNILKIEGCMPLTVASSGYYGSITATAIGKFQAKFGIYPTAPNNIGLKTLGLLNQAVSASL